tara:strand:- start:123 stop:491 length:369 start_codon:yes stop_codon:yes gene_type:complete
LESREIPTVIAGSAKDIVEHCGVSRFLFTDFPLGNSAGKPNDLKSQENTLEMALALLESAQAPRTTVQSSQIWSSSHDWKLDFQNVARIPPEEIKKRREEFDKIKSIGQQVRDNSLGTESEQ